MGADYKTGEWAMVGEQGRLKSPKWMVGNYSEDGVNRLLDVPHKVL